MKSKQLRGIYPKTIDVERLHDVDRWKFRKLLQGGNAVNDVLYIAPVDLDATISCEGFQIEHHQIVFSEVKNGIGRYYLVFRAIPLTKSVCGEPMYSHYEYKVLNYKRFMVQEEKKGYFDIVKISQPTYDIFKPDCIVLKLPEDAV